MVGRLAPLLSSAVDGRLEVADAPVLQLRLHERVRRFVLRQLPPRPGAQAGTDEAVASGLGSRVGDGSRAGSAAGGDAARCLPTSRSDAARRARRARRAHAGRTASPPSSIDSGNRRHPTGPAHRSRRRAAGPGQASLSEVPLPERSRRPVLRQLPVTPRPGGRRCGEAGRADRASHRGSVARFGPGPSTHEPPPAAAEATAVDRRGQAG